MSTVHRCDKCNKKINDRKFEISIHDYEKMFISSSSLFNRYEFCEKCASPLAKYLIKFLKLKKTK